MGQFILDGIQFTADNSTLSTAGKKTVKFGNNTNASFPQQIIDRVGVKPFVNAVEIDWNNAKLDNVELPNVLDNGNTVNTTGQLLALINDLQEQINAIVYIMNGGNTGSDKTTTTNTSSIQPQDPGLTSTTTVVPGTTTITPVTTLR